MGQRMLKVFQNVLERLKGECLETDYEPLLEADISGWLFHLLATQPEVNRQHIHLDTRVCGADGRFDIAIGHLRTQQPGRPCIQPQFVLEVKFFPRIGFTDQQHRVHYEHILNDDLVKLARLDPTFRIRAALIVDGRGYLKGTYHGRDRREFLIDRRNQIAPQVHVFIVRLADRDWQIEHEDPDPERCGIRTRVQPEDR